MAASDNQSAKDALLNGETAKKISVTHLSVRGIHNDRWAITLDIGWAQTIVAISDYTHHARGVAIALAEALDCPDVEWDDEVEAGEPRW